MSSSKQAGVGPISTPSGVIPIAWDAAPLFANLPEGVDGWQLGLRPEYLELGKKELVTTNSVKIIACPQVMYEYNVEWHGLVTSNPNQQMSQQHQIPIEDVTNKMERHSLVVSTDSTASRSRKLKLSEMKKAMANLRELVQKMDPTEPTGGPYIVATNNKDLIWATCKVKMPERDPVSLTGSVEFVDDCAKHRVVRFTMKLASTEPYDFSSHLNALHTFIGHHGERKNPAPASAVLNAFVALHMPTTKLPTQKPTASGQQLLRGNRFFVYDPTEASRFQIKTQDGRQLLYAIRGYFVSVRPGTNQLLLNINPTPGVFHHPMSVVDFMIAMRVSTGRPNESQEDIVARATMLDKFLSKFIVNLLVRINVERQPQALNEKSKQMKIVKGFGQSAARQTFVYDGRRITVQNYFKTVHDVTLKFPHYPCVNVGLRNRSSDNEDRAEWYPPELLDIGDNLPARSQLAHEFKDQLIHYAAKKPWKNRSFIEGDGLKQIGITSLSNGNAPGPQNTGGFQFDQKLMQVEAQNLKPPLLRDTRPIHIGDRASWNLKNRQFCEWPRSSNVKFSILYLVDNSLHTGYIAADQENGVIKAGLGRLEAIRQNLNKWENADEDIQKAKSHGSNIQQKDSSRKLGEIGKDLMALKTLRQNVVKFTMAFEDVLKTHGMQPVTKTAFKTAALFMRTSADHKPVTVLHEEIRDFLKEQKDGGCNIVLIVKPKEPVWYDRIKYLGDVVIGVKTQCITEKIMGQSYKKDVLSNIAMKTNFKLGGIPSRLDPKTFTNHQIDPKSLIILGADISSTQQGVPGGIEGVPNVAAVVGSLDDKMVHFGASLRLQRARLDRVASMKDMVVERLTAWKEKNNGKLPERMLFFRDGVGETQYSMCDEEIADIKTAYKEVSGGKDMFQLTFIVVGKRHKTRFYPGENPSRDFYDANTECLKPGMVVDTEITHRYSFDVYLQSHSSHQGTPRPAHYFVLENGMHLTAKSMCALTYAICHNYVRCAKSVSYAAPAYYADRLCDRGNAYLRAGLLSDPQLAKKWPVKRLYESDEAFYERCLDVVHRLSKEWTEAKGPWSKDVDNVMFWL